MIQNKFLSQALALFLCAFFIRAVVFYGFVQHEQRYRQADSMDYHICALSVKHLHALIYLSSREPIFWRTPGYPYFLSWFYDQKTAQHPQFEACKHAHAKAIWWQIILCSLLPLLAFLLAFIITQSATISWVTAIISTLHIGHILASCYLLTDALATLFFMLFLICFFSYFKQEKYTVLYILGAAISLAIYTWMRPNGIFMAIAFAPLILLKLAPYLDTSRLRQSFGGHSPRSFDSASSLAQDDRIIKADSNRMPKIKSNPVILSEHSESKDQPIKKLSQKLITPLGLFLATFFALLSPWYIRNHQLTGHYFFCPMMGPYLQAFSAPKIMRAVLSKPLEECIKILCAKTHYEHQDQKTIAKTLGLKKIIPQEFVCLRTALPWVQNYPLHFLYFWSKEVLKTTFDLYSYQLVAIHAKKHTYDEAEEFLSEKLYACLWKTNTPFWIKLIAWLEILFYIIMWIGILGSFYTFFLYPLFIYRQHHSFLGMSLYIIGVLVGMSGGFGYARLRLGAEPLMIILSIVFWYWVYRNWKYKETIAWINYMHPGAASMPSS